MSMLITVFTPTYNRAHLLPRLYESLKCQSFKDFEWLIVDDGSTDNTDKVLAYILKDGLGEADIRYFKQENGGKHRAINHGVCEARGELFFIADSDDYLPIEALQIVADKYSMIKVDPKIGGVCGLDMALNGNVIGSGLPKDEILCNSIDLRLKYHVTGDLKEVFLTRVLKEFPFPEIDGERFCPEALVWNRIAQKYDLLFFNKPIYIAEYQEGGLTDRIVRVRMDSPIASMICYKEYCKCNIPFKDKIKSAINFWRFASCSSLPFLKKSKGMLSWFWLCPAGLFMHYRDKK